MTHQRVFLGLCHTRRLSASDLGLRKIRARIRTDRLVVKERPMEAILVHHETKALAETCSSITPRLSIVISVVRVVHTIRPTERRCEINNRRGSRMGCRISLNLRKMSLKLHRPLLKFIVSHRFPIIRARIYALSFLFDTPSSSILLGELAINPSISIRQASPTYCCTRKRDSCKSQLFTIHVMISQHHIYSRDANSYHIPNFLVLPCGIWSFASKAMCTDPFRVVLIWGNSKVLRR